MSGQHIVFNILVQYYCLYLPVETRNDSDSNPFLTQRNDSCPFRKRLRPTHPVKFPAERTPFGGLTVTVKRNHY